MSGPMPVSRIFTQVVVVLAVSLYGAALTFQALQPTVGFDDANIAHAYASHIAAGHGYVYNVGAERVEGSTSISWTLLNSLVFLLFEQAEPMLFLLSFLMTAGLVVCIGKTAETLCQDERRRQSVFIISCSIPLLYLDAFGWLVWSLMDMTLWLLAIAILFLSLYRLAAVAINNSATSKPALTGCYAVVLLMPLVRPEGIALTVGLGLLLLLYGVWQQLPLIRHGLMAIILSMSTFLLSMLVRLLYFGFPFPNTYYAKTSTDAFAQTLQGLDYSSGYFLQPANLLLFVTYIAACTWMFRAGKPLWRFAAFMSAGTVAGGLVIYTMLGGDHFASYRFYLYFLVLQIPLVTVFLVMRLVPIPARGRQPLLILSGVFLLCLLLQTFGFLKDKGGYAHEFWIAEHGRYVGNMLNEFPGQASLGVVAAGGIRMGYHGYIYDVLGLNWKQMAHAESDDKIYKRKNHGAFNKSVFFQAAPDIFFPNEMACPEGNYRFNNFFDSITDEVIYSPEFRQRYDFVCWRSLTFFISREFATRLARDGLLPELQLVSYRLKP